MTHNPPPDSGALGRRIDGWKAIAAYAERSERALQRWATERGFPVHRVGGGTSGSVFAWTGEVDAWFARQVADPTPDAEPLTSAPRLPNGAEPDAEARHSHGNSHGAIPHATGRLPVSRRPWRALAVAATLGLLAGIAGAWGVLRPRTGAATPAPSLEPCHIVEWPKDELPATGGRWRLPVRAKGAHCAYWVGPTTESRWLLVTPPASLTTPRRITMSPNHPLAMPAYEPDATSLSLDLAANHTTAPREAVLQFGRARIRIRQAGMREACTAAPGPGYIDGPWRYRMTGRRYSRTPDLLAQVRLEVGIQAEGVSWQMLQHLLEGNPDRGVEFATAVGIPRHSWEEQLNASECFNVWLTEIAPPAFISYHMGRKPLSYTLHGDINEDQFDLGRWTHIGQALYRERVQ